jgi:hypothetical protein
MDLTLTHLRQLADVAAGLCDIVSRQGLCRITSELVESIEYRTKLRQRVEGAMGSLWKFQALLLPEHVMGQVQDKVAIVLMKEDCLGAGAPNLGDYCLTPWYRPGRLPPPWRPHVRASPH